MVFCFQESRFVWDIRINIVIFFVPHKFEATHFEPQQYFGTLPKLHWISYWTPILVSSPFYFILFFGFWICRQCVLKLIRNFRVDSLFCLPSLVEYSFYGFLIIIDVDKSVASKVGLWQKYALKVPYRLTSTDINATLESILSPWILKLSNIFVFNSWHMGTKRVRDLQDGLYDCMLCYVMLHNVT